MATRTNTSPVSGASGPTGVASGQPPLRPEQMAELVSGRRRASEAFQSAQASGQEQKGFLRQGAQLGAQQRNRGYDELRSDTMSSLGDRGMAFQPIGAGQGLRRIRDAEAQDATMAEFQLAMELAEVAEFIAAARRQRDAQLAGMDELEQQWRSEMIRDELANFAY